MNLIVLAISAASASGAAVAPREAPPRFAKVDSATVYIEDLAFFSYEARQTDPAKMPLIRETVVCTPRGEKYLLRITRLKSEFTLEIGYDPTRRPFQPEVTVGPVPTRDAVLPTDPRDASRFLVPMTRIRAGSEEMEFAVPDLGLLTVQRWLEDVWRGAAPDVRQALTDVLLAAKTISLGSSEDLRVLLGLVPREQAMGIQGSKIRKDPRGPSFCRKGGASTGPSDTGSASLP